MSEGHDKFAVMFRILENESWLLERADKKAISLLSTLGVFMVFFIVYYRIIPVNTFTVTLMTVYLVFAALTIWNLIMVVRPRVERSEDEVPAEAQAKPAGDPTFFRGICNFKGAGAYRDALLTMAASEERIADVYSRQFYAIARINAVKYKHVQRGVLLVIITLVTELVMIAYLFAFHMGSGRLPRID
jgi:hypothetical protein